MPRSVTDAERDAAMGYEALFVPALFSVWTGHLIMGAAVASGDHVLDVACGTGVLARAALARVGAAGRVTGLDPAAGMIAAADELEPGINWVLGRAETMDFDAASFDTVVSQFGMMFFQDRPLALSEMRRVLKPGGGLAVAVWDGTNNNPVYAEIAGIMDDTIGVAAGDAVRLPFCLGDRRAFAHLIKDAGFTDIRIETRQEMANFPTTRAMVEAELRGWLPLFGITPDENTIAEVLMLSDERLARYRGPSGAAVFPTSAHILTARRPG